MRRPAFALNAIAVFALSLPAGADDAGLRRCRALAEPAARLACYDALPLGTPAPASAAAGRAPALPAPAVPTAAPRSGPAQEALFGLAPTPAEELGSIESHIPGLFEGWRPNYQVRLANGQVWQIADETSSYIQRRNPRVTVRRGALGAFYLDIEGDNRSPRVRRVQ